VLYTIGGIVYASRYPDPFPAQFGFHEVFHALVVAASICHFAACYHVVVRADTRDAAGAGAGAAALMTAGAWPADMQHCWQHFVMGSA
jgi:hypothetical protein